MTVAFDQDALDILRDEETIGKLGPYHGVAYAPLAQGVDAPKACEAQGVVDALACGR